MNNISVYKLKNISLALSATVLTACLIVPLNVNADTSSSVDAIMEQLKSFKTQAPKVPAPAPDVKESKAEEKTVVSEPAKEEVKEKAAVVTKTVNVEAAPVEEEAVAKKTSMTVDNSAVVIPETQKTVVPVSVSSVKKSKKHAKKRTAKKRITKKKIMRQEYKAFDKDYISLINQIMNEQPQSRGPAKPMRHTGKSVSGWIYLGRFNNGKWNGSSTLDSGNTLPQVGQRYSVKSTRLNVRKSRPLKGGLGKLVKVLRAGEQLSVLKIHRSSRNNYWANISRP